MLGVLLQMVLVVVALKCPHYLRVTAFGVLDNRYDTFSHLHQLYHR